MSTEVLINTYLENSAKYADVLPIDGGMNGYSYAATNVNLGRRVFLKIVDYVQEEAASIFSEVQTIANVTAESSSSRNIVTVYDCDKITISNDDFLCFQMEFIDGNNLGQHIESGTVGQQDAIRLTVELLNGLAHLHQNRFLHRDLKPHNIMFANGIPKISDFGSSVRLPEGHTSVKASLHSALYVPPEGWQTPSIYAFESDLYQIGIVLYELINGCLNYEDTHYLTKKVHGTLKKSGKTLADLDDCDKCKYVNNGIAELARKQSLLEHGRKPLPYLSPRLERVIRKATNPEASKRYRTAMEFSTALQKLSLPNWTSIGDEQYQALSWKKYDWQVKKIVRPRSTKIDVSKRKTGAKTFRSLNTATFATNKDAFSFIEGV